MLLSEGFLQLKLHQNVKVQGKLIQTSRGLGRETPHPHSPPFWRFGHRLSILSASTLGAFNGSIRCPSTNYY